MARKLIILITGFLITFSPLIAEEYDLQSIIKLAIERNNIIKLAYADKLMASALKKEAFSDALPKRWALPSHRPTRSGPCRHKRP